MSHEQQHKEEQKLEGEKEEKGEKEEEKVLSKKLEECEKLRDEYLSGWQRAKADFLNYKRDELERLDFFMNNIRAEYILKMLEFHDELERAMENAPEELKDKEWVKGVLQIEDKFHEFFKKSGVEKINPEGEQFNSNFHEAVEQVESDKESGTIIKVVQKGYLLRGQLLRPAKVKVIK